MSTREGSCVKFLAWVIIRSLTYSSLHPSFVRLLTKVTVAPQVADDMSERLDSQRERQLLLL